MRTLPESFKNVYDVLIIGGGINGAAIANLAADNGLNTVLVEKGDFAGGTSSKSTKLIHGGLRYLENLEFGLVKESLKERYIQLHSAPHLVKPLSLIIPVYKKDPRPLWMIRLGVSFYDLLSGKYNIQKHQVLSVNEVLAFIPGIRKEGLIGGILYYDAQMDDSRLCLENILSARLKGAKVINYFKVNSFIKENNKIIGIVGKDMISNKEITIKAKNIICAAGPWTNMFLNKEGEGIKKQIRTTKGVHLVYKRKISNKALLLQVKKDGRIFFIIPFGNHSLIGTTDTDYTGNPDEVQVELSDIKYLLEGTQRILPKIKIDEKEIIFTFAGLRPLVYAKGNPSKISRNHCIQTSKSGVTYVMGGKYTTYRKIAEDCIKKTFKKKKIKIDSEYLLYGSGKISENLLDVSKEYDISEKTIKYLRGKYGVRYIDVLNLTKQNPDLKNKICQCSSAIEAQIVYAKKVEMACNPDDIIQRRLGLSYIQCETKECRKFICKYFIDNPI